MAQIIKMSNYRRQHNIISKQAATEMFKVLDSYDELAEEFWADYYVSFLEKGYNIYQAMDKADIAIMELADGMK